MSYLNPNRHTYLQKVLCYEFDQKVMNRVMDKAMGWKTTYRNLEPPFLSISTQIPITYSPNVDGTRAKKAFGRLALPKLRREIHHPDKKIVMQALNTISDMVHDPEKGFEAIKVGVVDRLIDMMLNDSDFIREKVCMIYYSLAAQAAGRAAIVRRYQILANLAKLMEDPVDAVRHKAQMVVDMIARHFVGSDALNDADFTVLLLRLIGGLPDTENEKIVAFHLSTLKMLLDRDVKFVALKHNAMDILLDKAEHPDEDISSLSLACISLLCWHPEAKKEADAKGILFILSKKLFDERRKVHTKAAGAIAFATLTPTSKNCALSLNMLDRLLDLLEDFHCKELQLMTAKCLTNLAEHPKGRTFMVKRVNLNRINRVCINGDADIFKQITILLNVIRWLP